MRVSPLIFCLVTRTLLALVLIAAPAAAQCSNWENRTGLIGGSHPPAELFATMTFDSGRGVTVAAFSYRPESTNITDLYEYDGANWTRRLSGGFEGPRFGFAVSYDPVRARTVIFGGYKGIGGAATSTNTLALWDGANMQVVPPSGVWPPVNGKARATWDPVRQRTIVICDEPSTGTWQTWEWTGSAWQHGPSLGPIGQAATEMVFDARRNRAFVYTSGANDVFEQVWEYTPGATAAQGAWARVTIPGAPFIAYTGSSLVYDPYRGRIIRFGGKSLDTVHGFVDGTWFWNSSTPGWELQLDLGIGSAIGPRGAAGVAFDWARHRVVIFGGIQLYVDGSGTGRTRYYRDTWELYDNGPEFGSVPSNLTVTGGEIAVFAAATIGEVDSLRWFHDGVPVAGAGGANPFLIINNAGLADAGIYWLVSTNACGSLATPAARLTVLPPANDFYLNPAGIFVPSVNGTTRGATADGTAPCGSSNASPDVWHTYTVPYAGTMTIDTCGSDFDTVLSLSTCCPGPGTPIGCSDDTAVPAAGCAALTSSLSLPVSQGQRFLVRIAGYQGASGNYTLNTRVVPFNNACGSATPVLAGTYAGTTAGGGATTDGNAACGNSNSTPDIWYQFRSDCSGTLTLDTLGSSFDTVMSLQFGCGQVVGHYDCNDDCGGGPLRHSCLSVPVTPGGEYNIRVSGYNGATGTVVLNVTPPPPVGDTCAGAVPIGLGERTFATRCATTGTLALPPWCGNAAGLVPFYDIWYLYTAQTPGIVEVRLCNTTFNTALAVYGSCPTSVYDAYICASREDSCGDPPLASMSTLVGDQYLLRVGGSYGLNAGLAGSGTIDLTLVPFEPGACCLSAGAGGAGGCLIADTASCAGTFLGEGTACTAAACPSFAGACCTGAACAVLDAGACAGAAGAFHGTGSACLASPQNPITCCRANLNGQGGLTVQDIFDFLSAYFSAEPRADFNTSGSITVQDIFDFLSAYFAGCQ